MSISFVAVSSVVTVASGNITLVEPAGCQDGDLLLACITYRDSVGFAMASGWTLIAAENTGNSTSNGSTDVASGLMAYKIRSGAASGEVFTRTGGDLGYGRIIAYRGVDQINPLDVSVSRTLTANSTTVVTSGGFSTAQANELLVMSGHNCSGSNPFASAEKANTDPTTGWTERADSGTTTGADGGLMISDLMLPGGG